MSKPVLQVENLCKCFGGVIATDNVSLSIPSLETHAIIGPNGAGKTTLLSQIAGFVSPDSGKITFQDTDITDMPSHRRALQGLARSFQITSLIMDMTVLDNVALAVQAHQGHSFHFWKPARLDRHLRNPAFQVLERVSLQERANALVSTLSHGEHRQLEIAIALAAEPSMLLLDEPMAGMGPQEANRLRVLLRGLKADHSILLIEHDMDTVFALADRITVMVNGAVIATGQPDAIRENKDVRQAYLGEVA